jgi:tetratricopeptide (TPR) repeat protein
LVSGRRALLLLLLALAVGGCAALRPARPVHTTPALRPTVPTADQLAAPYRAQAQARERDGQLRRAAEAWQTALALAPDHEPSRLALRRLRQRIEREIAEQRQLGWRALADGAPVEARRHFLAALALDPDATATQDALRVVASAAEAARPVSQTPATATAARAPSQAGAPAAIRAPAAAVPVPPDARPLYAAARAHLAEGEEEQAYRVLVQLQHAYPGYQDSGLLLRDLRARLVWQRYQAGLHLFRDERIEEAIAVWRAALELDPGHEPSRRSIEQAEQVLRTLARQTGR